MTTATLNRRPAPIAPPAAPAPAPAARIGPNAVIQTLRTLDELHGPDVGAEIAALAECPSRLDEMIDEDDFVRLVDALHRRLGADRTGVVLAGAGRRTGEYVRANRIPRAVAAILPYLPNRIGMQLLLRAFERNAWTFVGSGVFRWRLDDVPQLCIDGCITCRGRRARRPLGAFYQGAFESLLRSLVDERIGVIESECVATGGRTCRFHVHLPARAGLFVAARIPETASARCVSC
jgi:divinyl protochlorophyllide a 8-vinyl-reductase